MTPPLLRVEEVEGICDVSVIGSLKERNYLGLSEAGSSADSSFPEETDINLNMKATELRLGLPGSQSPERDKELCLLSAKNLDEKPLFPFAPSTTAICSSAQKSVVTGNRRGYANVPSGFSEVDSSVGIGKLNGNSGSNILMSPRSSVTQPALMKEMPKVLEERSNALEDVQVVGWPPIRSFRKKTLVATSKSNEEVDGKPGPGALFVKVSMDGAPYLRKVDLRTYSSYRELSSALGKMFSCFTIGQCESHLAPGREMLSENKLRDLLHGSEDVLTYEDKDGDWMLVGDVPWEMFIDSCKRLKIMKSSDAIGLAPRAMEKSKTQA